MERPITKGRLEQQEECSRGISDPLILCKEVCFIQKRGQTKRGIGIASPDEREEDKRYLIIMILFIIFAVYVNLFNSYR